MDENECAESDLGYLANIALCKMLHNCVGETKIFKRFSKGTNLYNGAKFCIAALQGDSMVAHHIGPNQINREQSSCLNLSANG